MSARHFIAALCLCFGASSPYASPFFINQSFKEVGNNVEASFAIKDIARDAYNHLPFKIYVDLVESDLFGEDFLGRYIFALTEDMVTLIGLDGYESHLITHTYINASDAFTGKGNDYELRLTVPEPGALFLVAGALVPLFLSRLRPFKKRLEIAPPTLIP